jgi:hypothetical protein
MEKETNVKAEEAKNNQEAGKDYYEAESWQFSSCGD